MARGDHYEVRRIGFAHHGIDLGDGTVVHFTGEPLRKSEAHVQRTTWDEFRGHGSCRAVLYSGWTWTADHTCLRALKLLGLSGYNLARNNCEHFASWCKTGQGRSNQIEQSAGKVWKYSRMAVMHPGYLLAGPAFEFVRRLGMGVAEVIRRRVAEETLDAQHLPPTSDVGGIGSFFHYGDLYTAVSGSAEQAFYRSPYDTWIDLSSDARISLPSDPVFYARILVDDDLLMYLWHAGGLSRVTTGSLRLDYSHSIYDWDGRKYRFSPDTGIWSQLVSSGWMQVAAAPAGYVVHAHVFNGSDGLLRLKTRDGWGVEHNGSWQAEQPDRVPLKYI